MDNSVRSLATVTIAALRDANYQESTISQYIRTINVLARFIDEHGGSYTPELGAEFTSMTTSPRTGKFSAQRRLSYNRLIDLFDSYLRTGQVDLSYRARGGGGPRPTTAEFVTLDTAWESDMVDLGLAAATRTAYGKITRAYLVFLEHRGINTLVDVTPATVPDFFTFLLTRWQPTSLFWAVSNLRPFFVYLSRTDLIDAITQLGIRRPHPIIETLHDDDHQQVLAWCASSQATNRDAAVTLLALTTGLRAIDIINLRLGDLNWQGRSLHIIQHKTGNPLTLPMTDLLISRLADYLLQERPTTDTYDHVFLRSLAPYTPLSDHASIHVITTKVIQAAGVSDRQGGTRLLRHTAATRLVRAAAPLPTVAAVLGHADPDSTNTYLSVDEQRLRDCVLPIPTTARS